MKNRNYSLFFAIAKRKIKLLQKLSSCVLSFTIVNEKSIVFNENKLITSIIY